MPSRVHSAPGYERFQPRDVDVAIQFGDEARERMLSEVMTGFGAVPRRGAEVGGILLGRRDGDTIWVDDIVLAPCEHRRGPSFLLSERDIQGWDKLMPELASAAEDRRPVGMFRSNTRDQDTITHEDRQLFRLYFPPPNGVFMLVRPFATKPSVASFLLYREGALPESSEPFLLSRNGPRGLRRAEPTYLDAPRERHSHTVALEPWTPTASSGEPPVEPDYEDAGAGDYDATPMSGSRRRSWMLIPLSFIFLLLGILLGFQAALTFYPKPKTVDASALAAGLTAARKGENLHIRWNRQALAITAAQRGTLEIQDGSNRKSVELDASALQNGSVIYAPSTDHVVLRFDITVKSGTRLIETLSWSKTPQ